VTDLSFVTDLIFETLSECLTPLVKGFSFGAATLLFTVAAGNCVTFSFELSLTEDSGELFLSVFKFVTGLLLELLEAGFGCVTFALFAGVGKVPGVTAFFDDGWFAFIEF